MCHLPLTVWVSEINGISGAPSEAAAPAGEDHILKAIRSKEEGGDIFSALPARPTRQHPTKSSHAPHM